MLRRDSVVGFAQNLDPRSEDTSRGWAAWLWRVLWSNLDPASLFEWAFSFVAQAVLVWFLSLLGTCWWYFPIALIVLAYSAEFSVLFVLSHFRVRSPILLGGLAGLVGVAVIAQSDGVNITRPQFDRVSQLAQLQEESGFTEESARDILVAFCNDNLDPTLSVSGEIYLPAVRNGQRILKTSTTLCFGTRPSDFISKREFSIAPIASRQESGIAGAVFLQKRTISIPDVQQIGVNSAFAFRLFDDKVDAIYPIRSLVVLPVIRRCGGKSRDPIAVVCFSSPIPNAFSQQDIFGISYLNAKYVSKILTEVGPHMSFDMAGPDKLIAGHRYRYRGAN